MVLKNFCLLSLRRAFGVQSSFRFLGLEWKKATLLLCPKCNISCGQRIQGFKTGERPPLQHFMSKAYWFQWLRCAVDEPQEPYAYFDIKEVFAGGGLPLLCLFPIHWSSDRLPASGRRFALHSRCACLERVKISSCLSELHPTAVWKFLDVSNLENKPKHHPSNLP